MRRVGIYCWLLIKKLVRIYSIALQLRTIEWKIIAPTVYQEIRQTLRRLVCELIEDGKRGKEMRFEDAEVVYNITLDEWGYPFKEALKTLAEDLSDLREKCLISCQLELCLRLLQKTSSFNGDPAKSHLYPTACRQLCSTVSTSLQLYLIMLDANYIEEKFFMSVSANNFEFGYESFKTPANFDFKMEQLRLTCDELYHDYKMNPTI